MARIPVVHSTDQRPVARFRNAFGELRRRTTVWQVLLVVALVAYVWIFTAGSLRIHRGLGTGAYDFGLYDQGMWLLSRGKVPFVTLMGRNLFGDHTSFILLFLVPFYWVAPGAGTLFVAQSIGLAAGAIPVFLLARRRTGYEWIAFCLAVAYLAHPTIGSVNTEDFHPDAFLPALVGFAIFFAISDRWRPYAICVVLVLLVKEDTAFILVPLGIWIALRRNRMHGLMTITMSLAYFVFASSVIYALGGSGFPNSWRIPFGGMSGFVSTALKRPGEMVDYFLADGRPWYLWQLGAPFAFGFLLLPEVAAIGSVVVVANVISNFLYQHQIRYHYSAVVVAIMAMGTAYALGRLRGRMLNAATVTILLSAMWAGFLWGHFPFSRTPIPHLPPDSPVVTAAWEMVDLVPADAPVAVNYRVAAHMAHRQAVYMFPNPFATLYYGYEATALPPGTRLPAANTIAYVLLRSPLVDEYPDAVNAPSAVWAREQAGFELIAQNDYWTLWRRR